MLWALFSLLPSMWLHLFSMPSLFGGGGELCFVHCTPAFLQTCMRRDGMRLHDSTCLYSRGRVATMAIFSLSSICSASAILLLTRKWPPKTNMHRVWTFCPFRMTLYPQTHAQTFACHYDREAGINTHAFCLVVVCGKTKTRRRRQKAACGAGMAYCVFL